jgi:hypothetical protein
LNKVNVVKWEPMSSPGVTSPFSPAKATVSEIDRISGQIASAFCRGGSVEHLPKRFIFPDMTQAGRLASTFGVPVVAMKENMASLKSSAKAEGLDLGSFAVSDNLTDAIDELSAFLEQASLGHFARAVPPYPPPPGYPPTAPLHSLLQIICSCVCASAGACFWREAASSARCFSTSQLPLAALKTSPASECQCCSA